MSIATDLTRIENAKAALKTSIRNKGVTVLDTTKIDGYSALVDSITSLNGETRTFTPNTTDKTYTPSTGKNAITSATVKGVTTSNLSASNIANGITVKVQSNSTDLYSVTGTAELASAYTTETALNGSLSGTTYTVSTLNAKGKHTSKLSKAVTPSDLGATSIDVTNIGQTYTGLYNSVTVSDTLSAGEGALVALYCEEGAQIDLTDTIYMEKTVTFIEGTTNAAVRFNGDANRQVSFNQSTGATSITNLSAGNVKNGVTIFGVTGTYSGPTLSGDAVEANVLSGKKFYSNSYTQKTGSMANNGAVTPAGLDCGGSYTIPAGYHNGSGVVTANSLSSQTQPISGTTGISPDTVLTGSSGWVNGVQIGGNMANNGATGGTISTQNGTYTIPAGYTSGGTVTASINSATSFSLAITDSTSVVSVGTASSGYYPLTNSLTGTLTAGTAGYFTSGSGTDSSVQVGKIAQLTLPTSTSSSSSGTSKLTISPSTSTRYLNVGTGYNNASGYYTISAVSDLTSYGSYITYGTTSKDAIVKTVSSPTTSDIYIYPTSAFYSYWNTNRAIKVNKPSAQTLPTTTTSSASYTLQATFSPSSSAQYINIPSGYLSAGRSYKINAGGSSGGTPVGLGTSGLMHGGFIVPSAYSNMTWDAYLSSYGPITFSITGGYTVEIYVTSEDGKIYFSCDSGNTGYIYDAACYGSGSSHTRPLIDSTAIIGTQGWGWYAVINE